MGRGWNGRSGQNWLEAESGGLMLRAELRARRRRRYLNQSIHWPPNCWKTKLNKTAVKNSTQTKTPLLSPTVILALNLFLLHPQKKPSWPNRDLLNRKSYANHAEINVFLAQESPIINDSSTRSLNFYIFVCTTIIPITNAQTHIYQQQLYL